MRYLLGIDFGGGASKATLLCEDGTIVATSTYEYPTYYPQSGYVEQNPDDWYEATKENIKKILGKSKINPKDISAVALDAATHTAVLMDENFNVLMPSIYWTDTRCIKEVEFLKENFGEIIFQKVFHSPGTIWTLPQLLWIKNNKPEIWKKVKRICFAKDYVRHCLTGDYVTDHIEAEGSMLYDSAEKCWSEELLGIIDFDIEKMPKLVNPLDIVGVVTREASRETGLCEGTSVLCGTTDTVMEVFAAGGILKGKMTIKLATAGRICVLTDKAYPDKNLINYSHFIEGLYYPGTATKSCAASLRWFRDTFGGDYESIDKKACQIPIGSEGVIFHPYLNGELTPYQNPALCASFIGMRANHTLAHFGRAVMEGVCMSMKDSMITLENLGIAHQDKAVIIGGGGKSNLWRQMLSDALGITLLQNKYSDSSFGSAMLAGIAMGIWKNAENALERCNEIISETKPNSENSQKYEILFQKYKAVQKALQPIYCGE